MTNSRSRILLGGASLLVLGIALAGGDERRDAFRQLDELLPTPNVYRTASGAPGHAYWQQRVDYEIDVDARRRDTRGSSDQRADRPTSTTLRTTLQYLWVQLDPNIFSPAVARGDDLARARAREAERLGACSTTCSPVGDFDGSM